VSVNEINDDDDYASLDSCCSE